MTAIECSAIWRERSLEWLKDHKIDYLEKVPGRLMYMYVNDMDNLTAFISDKSKAENNYITLPYRHLLFEIGSLSGVQKLAVADLVYYLFLLARFVVTTIVMLVRRLNIKQLFLPVFIVVGGSLAIVLAVHGETGSRSLSCRLSLLLPGPDYNIFILGERPERSVKNDHGDNIIGPSAMDRHASGLLYDSHSALSHRGLLYRRCRHTVFILC